jgi:Glycosyl hydrolases family 39
LGQHAKAHLKRERCFGLVGLVSIAIGYAPALAGCGGVTSREKGLNINWNKTTATLNTTATLQVVVNPPLQPGQPLGTAAFEAMRAMAPDYTRFQAWIPYPKLAVAELEPPTAQRTSWDFTLIDPIVKQFITATEGHDTVMDFSTIPQWMFVTDAPVVYPADPTQETWDYEQGTDLRDPTCQELADYYHRLASWYVDGGFSDENGVWHASGYHYRFPIWEVLNEPDLEHRTTPEDYVKRYDAIVEGVRSASPDTRFMGMALGYATDLDFIRYFLNPANHKPGIPLDYISYHFYAVPPLSQTVTDWQYELFQQADQFLATVRSIEAIRKQRNRPHHSQRSRSRRAGVRNF